MQISEDISADQSNDVNASRSDSASVTLPRIRTLFGLGDIGPLDAEANSNKNFSGSGASSASNKIVGTLTVTVKDVLPNGNLRVIGEKQIGTNREVQYLRFYGVVNPNDIRAGNTVQSSRVADARIEYRGKGAIDSATAMGWLSRFFLTVLPF
ncbi:MAG: flagellar basal body L-ring protein FlgH [Limnobacter sp.]|nr:flagellar basal body L-ring protein FlgH [Limnobacter sp.]